jgi:hypothetical protein
MNTWIIGFLGLSALGLSMFRPAQEILEIAALLDSDFIAHSSGSRLMLPTHPIKLRWISHYLHECITLLAAIMSGDEELSKVNPHLYLQWFKAIPNQAPSIAIGSNSSILFSGAEQGWFEEYIPRNYETLVQLQMCSLLQEFLVKLFLI